MPTPYAELLKKAESAADERRLREYDATQYSVNVVVTSIVPELGVAIAHDDGELELQLHATTPGVHMRDLHEGQKLAVRLQGVLAPRVLSASWVA